MKKILNKFGNNAKRVAIGVSLGVVTAGAGMFALMQVSGEKNDIIGSIGYGGGVSGNMSTEELYARLNLRNNQEGEEYREEGGYSQAVSSTGGYGSSEGGKDNYQDYGKGGRDIEGMDSEEGIRGVDDEELNGELGGLRSGVGQEGLVISQEGGASLGGSSSSRMLATLPTAQIRAGSEGGKEASTKGNNTTAFSKGRALGVGETGRGTGSRVVGVGFDGQGKVGVGGSREKQEKSILGKGSSSGKSGSGSGVSSESGGAPNVSNEEEDRGNEEETLERFEGEMVEPLFLKRYDDKKTGKKGWASQCTSLRDSEKFKGNFNNTRDTFIVCEADIPAAAREHLDKLTTTNYSGVHKRTDVSGLVVYSCKIEGEKKLIYKKEDTNDNYIWRNVKNRGEEGDNVTSIVLLKKEYTGDKLSCLWQYCEDCKWRDMLKTYYEHKKKEYSEDNWNERILPYCFARKCGDTLSVYGD
jgi:hypothetical protein